MTRYFAAHPTAANLLMIIFLVMGLSVLPDLKRETMPDFTANEVEVRLEYPGASAEDIEEAVCQRVEDAIDGVSDVEEVRCEAREGVGVAVIEMREGADFARFLDDVKTEVEAIDDFPDAVELPVIGQLSRTDHVISIAVTGPMSVPHLKAYAEQLKDRLQQLPDVSLVTIEGFSEHQLRIELPAHALHQFGVSISDIADAVARQSVDLPAGTVETRDQDVLIRFTDERRSPQELEELVVVGGTSGGEVRLGDIAIITDRFELEEQKIVFDGERAALLKIAKTKAEDALRVVEAVRHFIDEEQQRVPTGVTFAFTQDVSSIVRDRLQLLVKNGVQGLVLVFLTLWLFLRLRVAFWVTMGLPVSFLGGLFFMALLGYSINLITMVALLIALGLLMDDAIVISENIATQRRRGKNALDAAVDGALQVAPGVRASFLTTISVFGPLAFLEGDIGKVLKVLPVVLILVLSVSLVEAFLILPNHLAHALRHGARHKSSRFRERFEQAVDKVRDQVIGRAVDTCIRFRYGFVGVVVALLLIAVGMLASGQLKFRAFPDIDGDVIQARLLLPQGTPLWRTEAVVDNIVDALRRVDERWSPRQPGGRALVQHVSVRFNENADAHEQGPHVATVNADLLTAELRRGRLSAVLNDWRRETGTIPDTLSLNFKELQIGPEGLPIDIRLSGPDLQALKTASLDLQTWLSRYRGVSDLSDDLRPGKPELRLRLREGALALGLDASTIASQIRAAFYGYTASEVQVGPESYEVDVRLTEEDQDSLGDIEDFWITTGDGRQVPLAAVAIIEPDRGFARINRINGQRTVTIQGDVDTELTNAAEIIADTRESFLPGLVARHPAVTVSLEGQAKEAATTGGSLQRGFSLGLLAVFVLLAFQFRSYVQPLAIMAIIPLALMGVVFGHLVMGLDLSMPSMVGFVSLTGIVVNDSILLVEFLKMRLKEGLSVADAARHASRGRFRAVLLTSLTTIAGLLPLLFERSLQAQVLIPLITSIIFGLLATTLLVLFVVPALFCILDDFGLMHPRRSRPDGSAAVNGFSAV